MSVIKYIRIKHFMTKYLRIKIYDDKMSQYIIYYGHNITEKNISH